VIYATDVLTTAITWIIGAAVAFVIIGVVLVWFIQALAAVFNFGKGDKR
jgi:hypothetical protein